MNAAEPRNVSRTEWSRYRTLLRYVARYRVGWLAISVLSLATTGLALLAPLPMMILVDDVIGTGTPGAAVSALPGADTPEGLLVWVVVAGLAIFALTSAVEAVVAWLWIRVGQAMVFDLAVDTYSSTLRRSMLFHNRHDVGDSLSRVTGDSWAVHIIAEAMIFQPTQAVITIAVVFFVMWQINVALSLLAIAVVPLMVAGSFVLGARLRGVARERRETESGIQSLVQQTLSGIPVVQAYVQEDRHGHQFRELAGADIRWQKRGVLLSSFNALASGGAVTLGTAVVMWAGAHAVLAHELTVGELLVFLAYAVMLNDQMRALAGIRSALQLGSASVNRVLEVLEADPEVVDRAGAVRLGGVRGDVVLEGVSFGYEPDRLVLRGVDLSVRAGEVVRDRGCDGCGEEHVGEFGAEVLRSGGGPGVGGWSRRPGCGVAVVAAAGVGGVAGVVPVSDVDRGEHCVRSAGCVSGGDRGGGA